MELDGLEIRFHAVGEPLQVVGPHDKPLFKLLLLVVTSGPRIRSPARVVVIAPVFIAVPEPDFAQLPNTSTGLLWATPLHSVKAH